MKKLFPQLFFLLLIMLVTATFFGLILDYLLAVFWAVVIAILFYGTYQKVLTKVKGKKNLASALTLTMILLLVVIPILLVSTAIVNEGIEVYGKVQSGELNIKEIVQSLQDRIPIGEQRLRKIGLNVEKVKDAVAEGVTTISQNIGNQLLGLTQNLMGFVVQFFLMLYILFFFFRDGPELLQSLMRIMPLDDAKEWELMQRFASVARATAKGSMVVALVQGTIGGILFAAVGIPGALLWGVLMTVLSLLPIGSGLVWGPAAIILFIQGDIGRAIAIIIVGVLVIGLVDNFLRPRLVGQDTKMPDYLILLSTLGGIAWFGLSGFVLGPIIAALFITCWQMVGTQYGGGKPMGGQIVIDTDTAVLIDNNNVTINEPTEGDKKRNTDNQKNDD